MGSLLSFSTALGQQVAICDCSVMRRGESVFLHRCGGRAMPLPAGYYWRMMAEHPSMRISQLEVRDGK
ncbi:hypothetical protein [Nostoc sp. ChiQUE01b]|uniref:hypothetical protein n=1 Tax=Nostoc sp. ChiQUE01b TaxID=3075376 RepID=UPI002AD4CE2F|nr:hypothetical protein [Nostoc sp. ChiQUE01b]